MNTPPAVRDLQSDTWVAIDGLGRELPGYAECGPPRPGKTVGLFYFLWLGAHSRQVYDITEILSAPEEKRKWGPPGAFHFWGEPHLGYYLSDDPFVLRKHAQMLTDAGVDVLFFDVTNGFTYEKNYLALCRVFSDVRRTGRTTPQIAFLTHSRSGEVVRGLYDRFYARDLYPELWFHWKGRPLILAREEELDETLKRFFTVRESWAWSDPKGWFGNGRDKWPWLDHYPQRYGWHEAPDRPEEVPVCVAQHPVTNIGRSFHEGRQPPPEEQSPEQGWCFTEQWQRALEVDPELIFITGWNEWVAQRFIKDERGGPGSVAGRPLQPGDTYFVDQFNQEYSRDIEPMRGGHGDAYYYQMVAFIRRFKGVRPLPRASDPVTVPIGTDFSVWENVAPTYWDDLEDTVHRNHPAWEPLPPYVNTSGRNDFDVAKVARDSTHLYFYVRTHQPITPPEGPTWMSLLLNTDGDLRTGWEGFDFIVNRTVQNGVGSIERHAGGGWNWKPVGNAQLVYRGRELHLAIPRQTLGLPASPFRIDFKWVDHVPESGDIMDFIDQGDTAPNGRFAYRYEG